MCTTPQLHGQMLKITRICHTCQSCEAHMPALCVKWGCSLAHANHEQLDNTAKVAAHTLCMWCKYRPACIIRSWQHVNMSTSSPLNVMIWGLVLGLLCSMISCFVPSAKAEPESCQDAILYTNRYGILPALRKEKTTPFGVRSNEKPSIILGCPGLPAHLLLLCTSSKLREPCSRRVA